MGTKASSYDCPRVGRAGRAREASKAEDTARRKGKAEGETCNSRCVIDCAGENVSFCSIVQADRVRVCEQAARRQSTSETFNTHTNPLTYTHRDAHICTHTPSRRCFSSSQTRRAEGAGGGRAAGCTLPGLLVLLRIRWPTSRSLLSHSLGTSVSVICVLLTADDARAAVECRRRRRWSRCWVYATWAAGAAPHSLADLTLANEPQPKPALNTHITRLDPIASAGTRPLPHQA